MRFGAGQTGAYHAPRLSRARQPRRSHPPLAVHRVASIARREAGIGLVPKPSPVRRARPARGRFAFGRAAAGGAVLHRGAFDPFNVRQQRELAKGVRLHARIQHAAALHKQAQQLYRAGHRKEALALNTHAMGVAGIKPRFDIGERFIADLARTAYYTPGGLYAVGKGGYQDVRAAARGDLSFKRSRAIAKQMAVQPWRDIQHPLRHPGYTALDVAAIASLGAGTALRVGAGARAATEAAAAARAAEVGRAATVARATRAALTRPGYRGGSLLRRPSPRQMELVPGVYRLEPDNPLLRPFARRRVAKMQRRLDVESRMALAPQARGGVRGVIQQHAGPQAMVGRELRAMYRIPRPGGQLAKQLARTERHMSPEERTAARVILIEGNRALRNPAEAIARHAERHREEAVNWAASIKKTRTAAERRRMTKLAKTNEQVARDIEAALPVLKGATIRTPEGRRFLSYVAQTRRLSKRAEREAIARGHLTRDVAEARISNLARWYRGGKMVTERARKARKEHIREYPGKIVTERQLGRATIREVITRERTPAEAEARLRDIDKRLDELYASAEQKIPHAAADPQARAEFQRYLNLTRGKKGKRRRGVAIEGRVGGPLAGRNIKEVLRDAAIEAVEKQIAKMGDAPQARAYRELVAERHRLADALEISPEEAFGGEVRPKEYGTIREQIAREGEPAIVERERLARGRRVRYAAQEARPRQRRMEGGLGPEGLRPPRGAAYFPTGERFKQLAAPVHTNVMNIRGGEFGLGPPQAARALLGTLKPWTGRGMARGVVEKPAQAIALRYAAQHRLYGAQDLFEHARTLGTDVRRSNLQIAVRDTRAIPQDLKELVRTDLEAAGEGDINALGRAAEGLRRGLVDEDTTKTASIGEHVEGVRWVDRRLMKELYKPTDNPILKAAAMFNKPFRFLGIYLRPAYILTNYPQNVGMQVIEQGFQRAVPNLIRARFSVRTYGHSLTDWMEEGMGTARTESYLPTTMRSKAGRVERRIVEGITHVTDRDARLAAFIFRAREAGFATKADLIRLREGTGQLATEREAIFRRARRDAVDFDSMTPAEKQIVDMVYFYPWLTRASAWTARAAVNRPVKAAIAGQLGVIGEREQRGALGPIPRWLKGYIQTKAGAINPAPLWTPSTPAQVADDLAMISRIAPNPHEVSLAEQFGTPVLQAVTARNPLDPLKTVAPTLLLQRLGIAHIPIPGTKLSIPTGRSSVTFPARGLWPAVGPFVLGGSFPRKLSRTQVRKQAQLERKGRGGAGGPRVRPRGYGGFGSGTSGGSLLRGGGGAGGGGSLLRSP